MVIAIQTSPANALSSIHDLVEEIRDELDDDGFEVAKIYRAIARAESGFNRRLRTPKMETEHPFPATGEVTPLPHDFLELRHVYQDGEPDSPLRQMSPAGLRNTFLGANGIPSAFALENRQLVIGPVGPANLVMLYYARIPSLTNDNPSNWLLDEHPDVYLHSVLALLFNRQGDSDRAVINETKAENILAEIERAGIQSRYGGSTLAPRIPYHASPVRL